MAEPMLKSLARYEDLLLYEQPEEERPAMRALGRQIRQLRKASGYTRSQLVDLLGIDLELLVIVENGGGDLTTATQLWEAIRSRLNT